MKTFTRALFGLVLLLVAGCGYHVPSADDAWLGQQGRTMCVELFANRTVEPYLDTIVTDEVSSQLSRSRLFTLTEDIARSELLLGGMVTEFGSTPVAYNTNDDVTEYAARMVVEARLTRRSDGAVLWSENFTRREYYAAALDKSLQQREESLAARIIARRIAEDLMSRLLVAF